MTGRTDWPRLAPATLKRRLSGSHELALLDVREEGVFAGGHLFFSVNLPASHLEMRLGRLVPRRSTPVVLCDGGDGFAASVARKIAGFGYGDVAVLDGGVYGWRRAGFELFSGINVPSKAFGEFIERRHDTPCMSADELKARMDAGEPLVVLDSRPFAEYQRMNIPCATDCPGAELVLRVHDMAPNPETLVVVNCAGRTRSIIGAQSLINAGVPNPVMALKDGTMGWHLAGHVLERGSRRRAPMPSPAGLRIAQERARRLAARQGVRVLNKTGLARFRVQAEQRSLYLLDVRDPEEFARGHLAGSVSAPGGQLVQATDAYVATRGARLVLIDDLSVRALMTASWLMQMGWRDVFVLEEPFAGEGLARGAPSVDVLGLADARCRTVTPRELAALIESGTASVIDLATSLQYRAEHIPGAAFAQRPRLPEALGRLGDAGTAVLTCPDGTLARLAAAENEARPGPGLAALEGGTAAWKAAGLPLAGGEERMLAPADDVWYRAYDRTGGIEDAMRDYLHWEVALIEQIEREGEIGFRALDDDAFLKRTHQPGD